ncbi:MAG: hypothetical protein LBJ74_04850 [Heliobacteriaceae bacterium]|jgi:hypothetical protein|nr:hypothetical protein [Heliobacteriaceae bacterium]
MKISTIANYIDQPGVLAKLHKKVPAILIVGGGALAAADTHRNPERPWLRNTIVAAATIGSLMAAVKYGKLLDCAHHSHNAMPKIFSLKEIEKSGMKFHNDEGHSSKEIFGEIGRLSLLGFIPIIGGVAGGIAADKITGISNKKQNANKVKEGIYQFLANIFLCNVGAGAALFAYEGLVKAKTIKPSSGKKLGAILGGIITTGIIGGSYIANYIGKKCVNPLFGDKNKNSERRPEALDIALHSDDIATAGVFAGFKWIEPVLPLMYFVSGYRAGTGYRNHHNHSHNHHHHNRQCHNHK